MYDGIKSVITDYTDQGLIVNYLNQLENAIRKKDIESIKYCLCEISKWYNSNIGQIHTNTYVYNCNEHDINKHKIEKFVQLFETYKLDPTENYDTFLGESTSMTRAQFIQGYIQKLNSTLQTNDEELLVDLCHEITSVFSDIIPNIEDGIWFNNGSSKRDTNILKSRLTLALINENQNADNDISTATKKPIIFLSHQSSDKQYGDAIEVFLSRLGVKNEDLIYTSHPLHKVPLGKDIYDYLREHIHSDILMIVLWSDNYLESPACLNEMGAAWVTKPEVVQMYIPPFDFNNPKVGKCAISTRESGIVLNGDDQCKTGMIELKLKVENKLSISIDESTASFCIDNFIKTIKELNHGQT